MHLKFTHLACLFVISAHHALAVCATEPIHSFIDRVLGQSHKNLDIIPAQLVDDAALVRRVTLDLAGRTPTSRELHEYLASEAHDKKERLIDRLLASSDYEFHTRNELDIQLLARLQRNPEWRAYLLGAVRDQRPWNQLLQEILLPEKLRPEDKGAAVFLKLRAKDLDAMTNDTSTIFFGVNIACAKCHDHPLVPDWHQEHYFGFANFFKRTFATRRGFMAERFDGETKYTTTSGEEKKATFMFLNGKSVAEPVVDLTEEEWKEIRLKLKDAEFKDTADYPPAPAFSPRQSLVTLALEDGPASLLARNIANRAWARFMGRGLIHPLDQVHSENPPSQPEILDRLAKELVENGYDPRPMIRGIVLSDTYARATFVDESTPLPAPEQFAVQIPRPLSPYQYALSLWVASRNPDTLPGEDKPKDWNQIREQWEERSDQLAQRFEIPEEFFQVSVEEALLLSNNPQVESEFLRCQPETLVGNLQSLTQDDELIDKAYQVVLARAANEDERASLAEFLRSRQHRRQQAIQQLVWALLTSAEFRFNH